MISLEILPCSYFSFQVVFEAILEAGYAGDIAIDDFRIFDGECYNVMTAEEMEKEYNITYTTQSGTTTQISNNLSSP